jgi:hypothetical protein
VKRRWVTLAVQAGPTADAVVARLAGAVAAQAGLPIDRVRSVSILVDTLVGELSTDRISARFTPGPGTIEVALGPLMVGEGQRILRVKVLPDRRSREDDTNDAIWVDTERDSMSTICLRIGRT